MSPRVVVPCLVFAASVGAVFAGCALDKIGLAPADGGDTDVTTILQDGATEGRAPVDAGGEGGVLDDGAADADANRPDAFDDCANGHICPGTKECVRAGSCADCDGGAGVSLRCGANPQCVADCAGCDAGQVACFACVDAGLATAVGACGTRVECEQTTARCDCKAAGSICPGKNQVCMPFPAAGKFCLACGENLNASTYTDDKLCNNGKKCDALNEACTRP